MTLQITLIIVSTILYITDIFLLPGKFIAGIIGISTAICCCITAYSKGPLIAFEIITLINVILLIAYIYILYKTKYSKIIKN
ncbi:MAG: hypothetical protein WC140_03120 [Bacteroidales bacterium]